MPAPRLPALFAGLLLAAGLGTAAVAAPAADAPPLATSVASEASLPSAPLLRPTLPPPGAEVLPDRKPSLREAKAVGDVESEIRDAAKLFNLDPALVRAVAMQESGLRNEARSRRGAMGVMQMMPRTAKELGYDASDLRGNVRAGAAYLSMMMETFGGDVHRALAAYNAGPGAVQRYGGVPPFRETRNYVAAITSKLAVGAAAAASQPFSTTLAQMGAAVAQGAKDGATQVAQAAGKVAGPLAAGAAPFTAAAVTLAASVP